MLMFWIGYGYEQQNEKFWISFLFLMPGSLDLIEWILFTVIYYSAVRREIEHGFLD